LVERKLPKLEVAGSTPVRRFKVEGSNPFSRFAEIPPQSGISSFWGSATFRCVGLRSGRRSTVEDAD
jgi:hypothetical protein